MKEKSPAQKIPVTDEYKFKAKADDCADRNVEVQEEEEEQEEEQGGKRMTRLEKKKRCGLILIPLATTY